MYSARDRVENEDWLAELQRAADTLELGPETRSVAEDLFLSSIPDQDRSKRAAIAASLYAASLIAGDGRTQTTVAEATGVTRLTIQNRWKTTLEQAGLDPPNW